MGETVKVKQYIPTPYLLRIFILVTRSKKGVSGWYQSEGRARRVTHGLVSGLRAGPIEPPIGWYQPVGRAHRATHRLRAGPIEPPIGWYQPVGRAHRATHRLRAGPIEPPIG